MRYSRLTWLDINGEVHGVVDEELLLGIASVYIEKHRVLVETYLGRDFQVDLSVHEFFAVHLVKWQFALVSVVNHSLKLF